MTTINVTHDGEQLVHLSSWIDDQLHIECLRSSYKAHHLRAIAAALTEAADKLEPQKAGLKFKPGDRVRRTDYGWIGVIDCSHGDCGTYTVVDGDGWAESVHEDNLEPAPEPVPEQNDLADALEGATWEDMARIKKMIDAVIASRSADIAVEARRKMEENQP
jgi:hypothetical protein